MSIQLIVKPTQQLTLTHPLFGSSAISVDPDTEPLTLSVPTTQASLNKLLVPLTVGKDTLDLTPLLFAKTITSPTLTLAPSAPIAPILDFGDWTSCAVALSGAETVQVPKNLAVRVSIEAIANDRKFPLIDFTESSAKRMYLGREVQEIIELGNFKKIRLTLNFGPGPLPPKLTKPQEAKWLSEKEEEGKKYVKSLDADLIDNVAIFDLDAKTKLSFKLTETLKINLLPYPAVKTVSDIVGSGRSEAQTLGNSKMSNSALELVEAIFRGDQAQAGTFEDLEIVAAAERLYLGRDFIDNASLVSVLTARDPASLVRVALELEFRGDTSRAKAYYQQAARVDPGLAPAYSAFLARNRLPFLEAAISAYSEGSSAAKVALAIALGRDGRLEEARGVVAESLLVLSGLEIVHGNSQLGAKYVALYKRNENGAETKEAFENLVGNGETSASSELLGSLYPTVGEVPDDMLELAFTIEAGKGDAQRALEIYSRLGSDVSSRVQALGLEMRAKLGEVIEDTQDPYLNLRLGEAALKQVKLEDARVCLEKSIASYPTAYAYELLFQVDEVDDRISQGRQNLQRALEIDSESAVLWLELVKADLKLKRLPQARQSLGSFIKRYLSPSELTGNEKIGGDELLELIRLLNASGLYKEAEVILDLTKAKYGRTYDLQALIGDALNGQRRLYDALHAYEAATTLISPPDKKKLAALQAKCTPISTRLRNRDETTAMHQTFKASR